jgi:hypothetical protein
MRWGILATGVVVLAACGGASQSRSSDGGLDATVPLCTPGKSVACVGPGGCSGGQACNAGGTAYATCDCGGSPDAAPDASDAGGADTDAAPDADAASDANQVDASQVDASLADAATDAPCTTYTHSNGMGQTWTDCVPLGTYNEVQAAKACAAYVAVMGGQCGADCIAGYSAREPDDAGDGCGGTCITVAIWMYAPTTSTTLGQGCYIGPNTLAGWSGDCTGLVGGFGAREGSCPALRARERRSRPVNAARGAV